MSRNNFIKNSATNGGSVYCNNCEVVEANSNTFTDGYANFGGDIYLHNLRFTGTTPAKFSFHKHYNTIANSFGGAFYYLEESTSIISRISLLQDVSAIATDYSIFDNIKVLSNSGGLFYANVKKELILTMTKAEVTNLEVY